MIKQIVPRKFDRRRFLVEVNVCRLNGSQPFAAHGIDLAESGISLFTNRFIGVGERVELSFRSGSRTADANGCKIVGSIAYARVESDGNILGISFARSLSLQEMQAITNRHVS